MQLTPLLLLTFLGPGLGSPAFDRSARSESPERRLVSIPDPEDEEISDEAKKESEEMEELRALEEVALDPAAKPSADLRQSLRRLGAANPLRQELEDAFSEAEAGGEAPAFDLPRVTDLASFDISLVKDRYDIPMEMQPLVAQYIHFFQGPGRKWFRKWMSRSTRYIPSMQAILEEKGLPKDTVYLAMIESGFSPEAYSWARAAGPWQFIASTGKLFGLKQNFWVDERRDPSKATAAAASYLQRLHRDLGNWYLAWAAYNAGGGKLGRMVAKRGTTDFWQLSDGKGLAKETKHYVPKLIACALVAKHPAAFGFSDDEFNYLEPRELEDVEVTDATDLEVIARAADIPTDEVRSLNPELKRWCTPPATEKQPYLLHLPKGSKEKFEANFAKIAPRERLAFRVHRVKRGDTLSRIAASYHSAPEAILRMNGLRRLRSLRVNTELVVPVPSAWAIRAGRADTALERQVARARRSGYVPVRPDLEVPAGSPRRVAMASSTGTLAQELVNGRTRISYGVQDGDSLWTISQRFSCSVELLRKWNRLPRKAKGLQVGTVLVIWTDATTTAITGPHSNPHG